MKRKISLILCILIAFASLPIITSFAEVAEIDSDEFMNQFRQCHIITIVDR